MVVLRIPVAFISCCLQSIVSECSSAQASGGRIHWVANGFAGHHEFNSPVLLATRGVVVCSDRQTIPEALCADRVRCYTLRHEIVTYGARAIFGKFPIHRIATDIIRVTADRDIQSRVGEQNSSDLCQLLASARLQ